MVDVKLFTTLVKRSKTRKPTFSVEFRPGMKAGDILKMEGFVGHDAEGIMVLVNDEQSDADRVLEDGDRVELMVSIQGG